MVEKEKRKNVDLDEIRLRIKELQDAESGESERRATVIVQKIMAKLADGKADIDRHGRITVVFFSWHYPNGYLSYICHQLDSYGFAIDYPWSINTSWIPFMYFATLQLKAK